MVYPPTIDRIEAVQISSRNCLDRPKKSHKVW